MALYYIDVCIIFNLQKIGSIDQKVSELWPLAFDYLDILENLAFAQIGQLVKISKWAGPQTQKKFDGQINIICKYGHILANIPRLVNTRPSPIENPGTAHGFWINP